MLEFGLLGDVRADSPAGPVPLGPMRGRCVLAALLVDANRPVGTRALIDRVWGARPPATARGTLSTYLSHVRRAIAGHDARVERRGDAYVLVVDPDRVDLHRFDALVADARVETDDRRADARFAEALGLWRGDALTGVDTRWADGVRTALRARRLAVELDHVDVRLRLGAHSELLAPLAARADEHPLDERCAGQLVLALHRAGRPGPALAHHRGFTRRLADELGTAPGPELRELHRSLLAADPAVQPATGTVPRQLPAPIAGWSWESDVLTARLERGFGVVVVVGDDRTAFALRWAHDHAHEFPDGQLYADLRGRAPAEVLRDFLAALDVVPDDEPDLAALYRSVVADRKVLVLLDNAADTGQVTPLLPGGPACATLVTSRHPLIGLTVTHGALSLRPDTRVDASTRRA